VRSGGVFHGSALVLSLMADPAGDAAGGVVARGGAVAIGAGGASHATSAIMEDGHAVGAVRALPVTRPARIVKGGDAVSVDAGAAGGAALSVVEANFLGLGGRRQEQRKRDAIGIMIDRRH